MEEVLIYTTNKSRQDYHREECGSVALWGIRPNSDNDSRILL